MNRLCQHGKMLKIALCLGLFSLVFVSTFAQAETEDLDADLKASSGMIEIDYPKDIAATYRQRRSWLGINIAINTAPYVPTNLVMTTVADPNATVSYESMFSKGPATMTEADLGIRLNTIVGTLIVDGVFGSGEVKDLRNNILGWMSFSKKGIGATFLLDTILSEPYLVPYGSVQKAGFEYKLQSKAADGTVSTLASGTTAALTRISYGVLIQVNWLDPGAARTAFRDSGLENAYIDVFYTAYIGSSDEVANFNSDGSLGAGFRLEF